MVKRPRHREWGSSPLINRQVKKYGTIVGSSPTLSTSRFLSVQFVSLFFVVKKNQWGQIGG